MPSFTIRPYLADDFDTIHRMEVASSGPRDYPDLDDDVYSARWRRYLADNLGLSGVMTEGMNVDVRCDETGAYAGHVLLVEQKDPIRRCKTLIVGMLVIREDLRGNGLGARLLAHAERVARTRGIDRMALGVSPANPARRLYERSGYAAERVHMVKTLAARLDRSTT